MKNNHLIFFLILILNISCNNQKKNTDLEIIKDIERKVKSGQYKSNSSEFSRYSQIEKFRDSLGFHETVGKSLYKTIGKSWDKTHKNIHLLQKGNLNVIILTNNKYEILDQVHVLSDTNRSLWDDLSECRLVKNDNEEFIYGLIYLSNKSRVNKDDILKVWKVDINKNKIIEITPDKVFCYNTFMNMYD
ncbi:hypothetical protein [Tenacibaculum sp.]|uniref:hypothetical protein n=1 Tax=Tenacibaculum sp. TaxID=1906242 RepID=UPI003D0E076B